MISDYLTNEDHKLPSLAFHTMTLCGDLITIFGGMTQKDKINGDIYFLKLSGTSIINASYEKNKSMFPKPRHSHSANYDPNQKRLFIFGGYGYEHPYFFNQLCVLELKNFPTIVFQSIRTINITNRCRHATFMHDNKLYIYGGFGIDKNSKNISILNDFYYLDIQSGKIIEVTSKGGNEMIGHLFKITRLDKNDYAFFKQELNIFYIFNLDREIFTRVEVKFSAPSKREYYTINTLENDGRVLLLGGSNKDISYKDLYYLINYTYDQRVYWMWSRMDVFGKVDYGYSSHCSLLLANNHILIHGGTVRGFDCLNPEEAKYEPIFRKNLQILDIFNSYEWLRQPENDPDVSQSINNYSKAFNLDQTGNPIEKTLLNSMQHICAYIPKEAEQFDKLLIHGGEREDQTISTYHIFNLNEGKWMAYKKEDDIIMIPQLKGHAWAPFWQFNAKLKEYYVIITGGITIEHRGSSCIVENYEFEKKKVTNTLKQNCSCRSENTSSNVYAYQKNFFCQVVPQLEENNNIDTLKRFGHSMAYFPEQNMIYMLCGFIQYRGYVIDLIQLEIKFDENTYRKSKFGTDRNFGLYYKIKEIDLSDWEIKGRMYASVNVVFGYIFIFGGIRDNQVLNDVCIINMQSPKISVQSLNYDPKIILPRFGMSGIAYMDENKEDVSRIIIFGGTQSSGTKIIHGMTNELLIFQLKFLHHENTFEIEPYVPSVYGFSEKRIFHTGVVHESSMYVFGGLNTKFQILSIPTLSEYNIETSISDYEYRNPPVTFEDWELGTSRKQNNNLFNTKGLSNTNNISSKIENVYTSKEKYNSKVQSKNEDLYDEIHSRRSKEKLLINNNLKEEKSMRTDKSNEKENDTSRIFNESNNLIENKDISLINDEEIVFKDKNKSKISSSNETISNSINSSQNKSKKGFVMKGKKNKKTKNWDEDYD